MCFHFILVVEACNANNCRDLIKGNGYLLLWGGDKGGRNWAVTKNQEKSQRIIFLLSDSLRQVVIFCDLFAIFCDFLRFFVIFCDVL